jgi:MFS family permease
VLHYSAVESGAAFVAFAGTVVVTSNLAQLVVARVGIRATLTMGLILFAASAALLTRLPVDGRYFWDIFPAFVIGGAGMGFSFVPITIASVAGVERADAGVASGLINTSRQIGGAIGLAAISAIATTQTRDFAVARPGVSATSGIALDHGFEVAYYTILALLTIAIVVTVALVRPAQPTREPIPDDAEIEVEQAA